MSDIKKWEDRAEDEHGFIPGDAWKAVYMAAEIAELRAALAKYEAQMLRMATCAGEFARDACKAQAPSAPQPPSTLAQQVASAQAEMETWTDERRKNVRLAGGDQP